MLHERGNEWSTPVFGKLGQHAVQFGRLGGWHFGLRDPLGLGGVYQSPRLIINLRGRHFLRRLLAAAEIVDGSCRDAINFGLLVLCFEISILAQRIGCGFRRYGNVPRGGLRRLVGIAYQPP